MSPGSFILPEIHCTHPGHLRYATTTTEKTTHCTYLGTKFCRRLQKAAERWNTAPRLRHLSCQVSRGLRDCPRIRTTRTGMKAQENLEEQP